MNLKKALLARREKVVLSQKSALSTGSTLLNLACTDDPGCGFLKGAYYYLVGDSVSGKTWLSLTCFAEASINSHFKNYRLIFDDVEGGALMDIERYFGKTVARRMEPPAVDEKGRPRNSETIQGFYYNLRRLIKAGKPFVYVLDSQDALDSITAAKKFDKQQKADQDGQDSKGSFGDGKAKYHSENIRWALAGIKRTKSILIIIGQTRDNVAGWGFDKKTRSGGRALRFYASIEIWTSVGKRIKKTVRGIPRSVGVYCLAEVKKNRVTGKVGRDRQVSIPIYNGYGIDDVGSCIDYLIENNTWRVKKLDGVKQYQARELNFTGTRGQIIVYVEQAGLEDQLRSITAECWRSIEAECQLSNRKRRYE